MNQWLMLIHSIYFCSVIGAFYAYLIIDSLLRKEEETGDRVGQSGVLFLLTLPFFFIFLIGCHSMYLMNMLMDELKARKDERQLRNYNNGSMLEMSEFID
jgi:hypothetical protein